MTLLIVFMPIPLFSPTESTGAMNHDFLIRTTNRVALYTTIALLYWVFIFLVLTVFDLKIFRERMTEMFLLSVLGIFSVLGGAVILNVMSNLSKISASIAEKNGNATASPKPIRLKLILIALSFPLIAAGLYAGSELSAQRKKEMLISSAQKLVAENQPALTALADYTFTKTYIKKAEESLEVIGKIDKDIPEVMLIVPDAINDKKLFLAFGGRSYFDPKKPPQKTEFIFSASQEERDYLERVFNGSDTSNRFKAGKGHYQLYFPATISGKKIVLYFADYQRYGKYGS
jgi:hypothetical protein